MSINIRLGGGYDLGGGGGGGGGGGSLTVSISPATSSQAAPASQAFTATPLGGVGPYSYAWSASYANGDSANPLLSSLTTNPTTLTALNYDSEVLLTCVVSDDADPSRTGQGSALLQVLAAPNLTASISPAAVNQASPGAQVLTVTPAGGSGSYTYAWTATQTDGADASANLSSLTGNPVTLTTTNYRQGFRVQCEVIDVATPSQVGRTGAVVSVGQPPALAAPAGLAPTQLPNGSTTTSFTFGDATGGGPPYTYAMIVQSSTGAITLDTYVGKSANILGLTDGATAQVTVQVVDSFGQTEDATYVVGVGVVPVFNENAIWDLIGGTDLRTIGSGSRSGTGSLAVGDITFNLVTAAGVPTGQTLSVSASGVAVAQVGAVGAATGAWWETGLLPDFTTCESILVNMLFSVAAMPTNSVAVFTFGDAANYIVGNNYGFSINWNANGARVARRVTGGTSTNYTFATGLVNSNKTYAAQVLLVAGRLPYCTISESATFLGGPRLGLAQPMRGTYTGTPGAQSTSSGATFSPPISTLRMQMASASASFTTTMLAYEVRRLTRAS